MDKRGENLLNHLNKSNNDLLYQIEKQIGAPQSNDNESWN